MGILGHSRGGSDALIVSSKRKEIKAVVTWAAVANFDRYTKRQAKEWRKNGFFEVLKTRTNQMMRLNLSLLEDIEKNKSDLLNIEKAANNLNKPLLIIHGEQDLSVKIEEGEQIYNWSNKELAEFYKIKATGHTFHIPHPFAGSNHKFDSVLDKTLNFFNKHLNEGRMKLSAKNLYLIIDVKEDPRFERHSNDLHTTATASIFTAILGGEAEVETLEGKIKLNIPAGTQPEQVFRLAGRGMPHVRNPKEKGDLYVRLKVQVPKYLSAKQRELLEEASKIKF